MTLKHKITSFWVSIPERKRQWGLLIFSVLIFLIASEFLGIDDGAIAAFESGFNETANLECDGCKSHRPTGFGLVLYITIGACLFFAFSFVFTLIFGRLFYGFLFRFILNKITTLGIITFVFFLLSIYNLQYDIIQWIFIKRNSFADKGDYMEVAREYVSMAISFMLVSIIIGYGFIRKSFKTRQEQALLLQQKSTAEIQALKAQINPHFLFNTLNNLYGMAIVEDSPKTAGGIQQLAGIMRHAVEGSKNDKIGVDKEIKFLHDYIEIQKIRLPDLATISVNYEINWDEQPAEIAPLILMTFIENAFKYGISTNQESFVNIFLTIDNQQLKFSCSNSIVQRTQIEAGTETGIDNTRKRLELLYPEKYSLQILEEENEFNVRLTMNLT